MAEFAKAKLQRVTSDEMADPIGDPIQVQFNPTTLRIAIANSNDTGKTVARQRAQYLGTGSATLTVELTFDTADEGTTEDPKSVLDLTTPVEQLLLPQANEAQKQNPPTVRFEWGKFILTGLVESMTVDLELFSASGVPLRARVGLSIKEQKSDFEFLKKGAGANKAGNAVSPGKAGPGAVGGIGFGASASLGASLGVSGGIGLGASVGVSGGFGARAAVAIEGESAANFAARVGVDPAAWRAVAAGQVDSTLSIPAGLEIGFDASASAAAGMGASAGAQAGAGASIETAFGLAPPKGPAPSGFGASGFALSAAGGVSAALETVSIVKAESASASTRHAFGMAAARAAAAAARPDLPEQPRSPLSRTGTIPRRDQRAESAPPAPQADRRSITFGAGVPLRPRVGGAAETRRRALNTMTPPRKSTPGGTTPGRAVPHGGATHADSACSCGCGKKG